MNTASDALDSPAPPVGAPVACHHTGGQVQWRRALEFVVMLAALSMVLATAWYFTFAQHYSGYEREVETGVAVFLWHFAVFGLAACFLRNVVARTPVAVIGLGYSALQFANAIDRNRFRDEMIGTNDASWRWSLALSLVMLAVLLIYDRYRGRLPQVWQSYIRHISLVMIWLWLVPIILIASVPFIF